MIADGMIFLSSAALQLLLSEWWCYSMFVNQDHILLWCAQHRLYNVHVM